MHEAAVNGLMLEVYRPMRETELPIAKLVQRNKSDSNCFLHSSVAGVWQDQSERDTQPAAMASVQLLVKEIKACAPRASCVDYGDTGEIQTQSTVGKGSASVRKWAKMTPQQNGFRYSRVLEN